MEILLIIGLIKSSRNYFWIWLLIRQWRHLCTTAPIIQDYDSNMDVGKHGIPLDGSLDLLATQFIIEFCELSKINAPKKIFLYLIYPN